MSQLQLQVELPRTKPTLALESCADFFDRDYDTLMADIELKAIRFTWDISVEGGREWQLADGSWQMRRREIRIFAASAWAFHRQQPMPAIPEDEVYKLILPNRDLRSTELKRILACSSDHVHALKSLRTATGEPVLLVTRAPAQADGPNSYTVFGRASLVKFLKGRRLS